MSKHLNCIWKEQRASAGSALETEPLPLWELMASGEFVRLSDCELQSSNSENGR